MIQPYLLQIVVLCKGFGMPAAVLSELFFYIYKLYFFLSLTQVFQSKISPIVNSNDFPPAKWADKASERIWRKKA